LPEIEACFSVAGGVNYMLFVHAGSPEDLEGLLQEIRSAANVTTQTWVVMNTYFSDRIHVP